MKHYKTNIELSHPVYSELIDQFPDLLKLKFPSKNFILFLAGNFSDSTLNDIHDVAKKLIDNGLAYILTWGPGCEKAHDSFDEATVDWQIANNSDFHVMSSWHSDEPLEEALWNALFVATVTDDIWDDTSILCVSIGNRDWFDIIDRNLNNLEQFNEERVNT